MVFYEVNGFKFSEYYYSRLWTTGRGAPGVVAGEVLNSNPTMTLDTIKGVEGFYKYIGGGWEMVLNPLTREVWHLQPLK